MTFPSVLFFGGTGIISTSCVRRAVEVGYDVTVLNRGNGGPKLPADVRRLTADVRDAESVKTALAGRSFDAVADFLTFTPEHLATTLSTVEPITGQYIFISSASAYQKPVGRWPITESTPLRNPFWRYSRDKIACEDILMAAYRDRGLPMTIVRPSHTYDERLIPTMGGWTDIARMRAGKPVIVHGDGTSLWTITHATDFAKGFVPLLGRAQAIGEAFHITGDEYLSWDQIYTELAHAAGVSSPVLAHVASDRIARELPDLGPGLIGDKAHCIVLDNSKIKSFAPEFVQTTPFSVGARQIVAWYDSHSEAQVVDAEVDAAFDLLAAL